MFDEYHDLITIEELCMILSIGKNIAYKLLQEEKIKAFASDVPGGFQKNQ